MPCTNNFFYLLNVQHLLHLLSCLVISSSPNRVLEAEYIGGVTLNHLCWAQLLGSELVKSNSHNMLCTMPHGLYRSCNLWHSCDRQN